MAYHTGIKQDPYKRRDAPEVNVITLNPNLAQRHLLRPIIGNGRSTLSLAGSAGHMRDGQMDRPRR